MKETIYTFNETLNNGENVDFEIYKDKVLLIVNTASKCGFTPQYEGLQKLYDKYKKQGLEILAFPCNQFGHQEPGSDLEIKEFCDLKFNVSFPLFNKIAVNGPNTNALYSYLKEAAPGVMGSKAIKWNFTKFLVNKKGIITKRYAPTSKPTDMTNDIKALLSE